MKQILETDLYPEKIKLFQDIIFSKRTVTQRTEDRATNLHEQLKDKAKWFLYYSLTLDESNESNDISNAAELLIFIRGIDDRFFVHEELASASRLHGTTTVEDLFAKLKEVFSSFGLKWRTLSV
jgi:hypothetical protein